MSNERIDEFLSWRGRLDDPAGIPGEGLDDREATWERLMDKIGETPRRRRFFGYRLAAACVLLALIPAVRFFHLQHARIAATRPIALKRVVSLASVPTKSPAPAPSPAVSPSPSPHHPAGPIAPPAAIERPAANPRPPTARREKPSKPLPATQATQEQPVQLATLSASPMTTPATLPDKDTRQLTIKPLKNKPLRVVHINELPGGAPPSPAITASGTTRHFEIFLMPSQSRLALPPPPPAADPALLKVKLSSSN